MKFKRTKCNCKDCPLDGRKKIHSQGRVASRTAFFGDFPNEMDSIEGVPFTGKSGGFFSAMLGVAEVMRSTTWLGNVITCYPPFGELGKLEAEKALECCMPGFYEELEWLESEGVKGIGAFGPTAMKALGVEGNLNNNRGSTYEKGAFYVTPIYHPNRLLNLGHAKKGGRVDQKAVFIHDLRKVRDSGKEEFKLAEERFITSPSLKDIEEFFITAKKEGQEIALDLETYGGLNPRLGTKILCLGVARDTEHAVVIPFMMQHLRPYWSAVDYPKMIALLRKWLPQFRLIIQNALFDIPVMAHTGLFSYEVLWKLLKHDTMVLHHCINPDMMHNLGFIVSTYGDTPYWKDTLKEKDCATYDLPNDELWTYNGRDCVVMHQILPRMLEDLADLNNLGTYYDEELPLLPYIMQMMDNGVLYDRKKGNLLRKKWTEEQSVYYEELRWFGIPECFNFDSDDQMRWLLWGKEINGFKKIKDLILYEPKEQIYLKCSGCKKYTWVEEGTEQCPKCDSKDVSIGLTKEKIEKRRTYYARKPDTQIHQNLLDLKALYEMEIPILREAKAQIRKTDGGKPQVDSGARLQQIRAINARLKTMRSFKHQETFSDEKVLLEATIRFLGSFQNYTEHSKLISTYTKYDTEPDGRVHGQIIPTGTGTGRLAMRKPNLMNLPKRRKEARSPFVAPEGKIFLSPDYTNLEVFIYSYATGNVPLQKFLQDGGNVHDRNTITILTKLGDSNPTDTNPAWNDIRAVAKILQFGGIQYGGSDAVIFENVLIKCPKLQLTFGEFQAIVRALKDGDPYYHPWADTVGSLAKTQRVAYTFLGRIRQLMGRERDLEKQGMNTPIQGGAAGIMNRATITIGREEDKYPQDKLILQVHDQLLLETNNTREDIERCNAYLLSGMQQEYNFAGRMVSFPADMEIGYNFGELIDYKKFIGGKGWI